MLTFSDDGHRYMLDNKTVPNVTTIINGGLPKGGLPPWYAEIVATYVADHVDEIPRLAADGRDPMIAFLTALPVQARNSAGVRGRDVHAFAERLAAGEPDVEVPHALGGYVDGYARFLDDFEPIPLVSERPVANRAQWYAGRPDLIARMGDGLVWCLDVKTSKRVYGDVSLQVAAYARAEFYVDALGDEHPLPHVDRIGVLHVTPGGTELYPLGDIGPAFAEFRACQTIYRGANRRRYAIGDPITPGGLRPASVPA